MDTIGHEPVPEAPRRRRWTVGRSIVEVVLIAIGVFLGLAAEQWRDRADRNERAAETLRRIRAEMAARELELALAKLHDDMLPLIHRELGK